MSKLFEEMAQGLAEARAYMEGERKGYRTTLPESIDVKAIRVELGLTQSGFADAFGLSVDAVRHWESGRRVPEAPARALLMVIAHSPEVVMEALGAPGLARSKGEENQHALPSAGRRRLAVRASS